MKRPNVEERKMRIAHSISCMPRKILKLHGRDNVIEFVLHELGKTDNFNLHRAAYVIDNPDFDCLKGIAGFDRQELYKGQKDIWEDPDEFSRYMSQCKYNAQVRNFQRNSSKRKGCNDAQIVEEISHDLGFNQPKYYTWDMKYDNHGILLYEKVEEDSCDCDYLLDGLCLIGFCPVF